jgi:hypothetical protein
MPKEREVNKADTRCVCCSIFWFKLSLCGNKSLI